MANEQKQDINIEVVSIDDLVQDDHNFNRGTEEGAQLIERSFREHGAGRSVFIDRDNRLVGGNKAQKGFKAAGKKKVIIVDSDADTLVAVRRKDVSLDTAEGRQMAYLDNLTTQVNLSWDQTELEAVQADVEGFEVSDFGYEIDSLPQVQMPTPADDGKGNGNQQQPEAKEDDFDPDVVHESKVHRGEVWQLGEHRLMCGDSTSSEDFAKLMNGERADIAFTSPPYNMAVTQMSDKCPNRAMHNGQAYNEYDDNKSDADYTKLLEGALANCLNHADDVMFNVGILKASKMGIISMLNDYRDKFCDIIIWNKSQSMPLGLPSHAGCVSHRCELIFCFNQDGSRAFSHPQWSHGAQINRIDTENASNNEYAKVHAATFPIALPSKVITGYSEKSVIDCFGGTGTTMIACEQLGRKCYMMELDPHYCTVIIARWEKLTGRKAERTPQQ